METPAAIRGPSLSIPLPLPARREWRAVSDHPSRSSVSEGRELAEVDFCSIIIDGSLDNDNVQNQLQTITGQRKELEHMEIELRARIVAHSGLMEMQKSFDSQFKEHANAYANLQDQLHQKEQAVHELEMKIDEKDRELHAVKLDNEAAWAKEDLLREQNKELLNYRRERDNSEAERSQHLKQIHDLQEHIQDRERQFLELQEQHRVAQEAIMYKDEQLREAQAWITRVQEMDALQSTNNHNLQAELRERTEQYNQLWLACQRQFAEMERVQIHTVQQLQIELANARERIITGADGSRVKRTNSNGSSHFASFGNQLEPNGSVTSTANSGAIPKGNMENQASHVSNGNMLTQPDHVRGVAIAPPTLLAMSPHLPPTQMTALNPFIMHQQGIPSSAPESHVAQIQPAALNIQHWQNQQLPTISQDPPSQKIDCQGPVNGGAVHPDYLEGHIGQGLENNSVNPPPAEGGKTDLVSSPSQGTQQHISSQFQEALRLDPVHQKSEAEGIDISANHILERQGSMSAQSGSSADSSSLTVALHANIIETTVKNESGVASSEVFASSGMKNILSNGKSSETALLDERSLLACIVRTIPPGSVGKIRISSTLPNRLGKMLAPLHWYDYKKKYGKLDDFVAGHPELFLIEGDYIQLQEGAQEIIAATTAVANVAAAAKTAASQLSAKPSIAVTPMAQSYRLNGNTNVKIPSKPNDMNGSESRQRHSSGSNSVGKQQDRRTGLASNFRR